MCVSAEKAPRDMIAASACLGIMGMSAEFDVLT